MLENMIKEVAPKVIEWRRLPDEGFRQIKKFNLTSYCIVQPCKDTISFFDISSNKRPVNGYAFHLHSFP